MKILYYTQKNLRVIDLFRTMDRDNNTEEQVRAIIAAQMSRDEKRAMADDIVENMGTVDELREQIHQLHARYIEFAE